MAFEQATQHGAPTVQYEDVRERLCASQTADDIRAALDMRKRADDAYQAIIEYPEIIASLVYVPGGNGPFELMVKEKKNGLTLTVDALPEIKYVSSDVANLRAEEVITKLEGIANMRINQSRALGSRVDRTMPGFTRF